MITLQRTTPEDPVFRALVAELDAELSVRYGAKQREYDALNTALDGGRVVVALNQGQPVGCGCFKGFGQADTVELKRMYVQPSARRLGVAQQLVTALEQWATEEGYAKTILQTAIKQPEAIALYQKCGYQHIDNFGAYAGDTNSVCMEKHL